MLDFIVAVQYKNSCGLLWICSDNKYNLPGSGTIQFCMWACSHYNIFFENTNVRKDPFAGTENITTFKYSKNLTQHIGLFLLLKMNSCEVFEVFIQSM